jgi:hypothetical protein
MNQAEKKIKREFSFRDAIPGKTLSLREVREKKKYFQGIFEQQDSRTPGPGWAASGAGLRHAGPAEALPGGPISSPSGLFP